MNFLKNKFKLVMTFLIAFLVINSVAFVTFATNDDEGEKETLIVEVIFNQYDEEYIKNMVLDDGTRVRDYDYTIKYSPTPYSSVRSVSQYFYVAAWVNRSGVISLQLDPTYNVRNNTSDKNAAWAEITNPSNGFVTSSYWRNGQVMQWQYDCHFNWAKNKDTWNLEPHRVANSYAYVVLMQCNP